MMNILDPRLSIFLLLFLNHGKWGFIDIQGQEVVSPQYDFVGDFSQGKAFVRNGSTRAVIDGNSNVLKKSINC